MNKHSRLITKRATRAGADGRKLLAAAAEDPMWFLFERHRHNPFVRFLREAFFYDDEDPRRLTRDRVRTQKVFGSGYFDGSTLRY
jgi:hypothetical protein